MIFAFFDEEKKEWISIMISKLFVNSWINSYGLEVSAFAGIANKITSVSNLVSTVINTAGSTMVSQNLAAEEYKRVKSILKHLAVIGVSVAVIASVVMCVFPMADIQHFYNRLSSA